MFSIWQASKTPTLLPLDGTERARLINMRKLRLTRTQNGRAGHSLFISMRSRFLRQSISTHKSGKHWQALPDERVRQFISHVHASVVLDNHSVRRDSGAPQDTSSDENSVFSSSLAGARPPQLCPSVRYLISESEYMWI